MKHCFGDLRTIAGARQSLQQGFDPLTNNPGDPLGRPMNYPRVWLTLARLGFAQQHVQAMGAMLVFLFLVGVWLNTPREQSFSTGLFSFALLLSPSTLLCIERGNTDLLMFFLVSKALTCAARARIVAFTVLILVGFALKLYPIFAAPRIFLERRPVLLRAGAVLLLAAGSYVCATFGDLHLIKQSTPPNYWRGYGATTWCSAAAKHFELSAEALAPAAYIAAMALTVLCLWYGRRVQVSHTQLTSPPQGTFLAGASIYVGTFLLGSNYDYRLIFLLFAVPQLALWAKACSDPLCRPARIALVCAFVAAWHTVFPVLLPLPRATALTFSLALYLTAAWVLYALLAILLAALLFPVFARALARNSQQGNT